MSWRPPLRWPSALCGGRGRRLVSAFANASTGSAQYPCQGAHARMTVQVLQYDREPAAPVRMRVDRPRDIGLILNPERVLDRNEQNPTGRGGEIAGHRQEAQPGPLLATPAPQRRAQRSVGRRPIHVGLAGIDAERAFFLQITA